MRVFQGFLQGKFFDLGLREWCLILHILCILHQKFPCKIHFNFVADSLTYPHPPPILQTILFQYCEEKPTENINIPIVMYIITHLLFPILVQ